MQWPSVSNWDSAWGDQFRPHKVSIVYTEQTETEQEAISVVIFINALVDADVVQKHLEEHTRSLAKAYEIAHRCETTWQAARTVTQLMQLGLRNSAKRRARGATVREHA